MYLKKIGIKNFRTFDESGIEAIFNQGVNAIIGENNSGKTALIDAIRISFSTVPYSKDIYFTKTDFHIDRTGKRAEYAQFDIYLEDVPNYLIELWDPEQPNQGEFHLKFSIALTPSGAEKVRYSSWGGKSEGNQLSPETFEALNISFLSALRDAENEMRPSKNSKLANLLSSMVQDNELRKDFVNILAKANRGFNFKVQHPLFDC